MNDRRPRDKEQTISDILTAATRLFSANGLHGTSLRDIEKASGVSKGLILHHFETKENLYAAVQEKLNQEYVQWMLTRRQESKDMISSIQNGINGSFKYASEHPSFQRIALWSYLEGQQANTDLEKRFTANLIETMRSGQQDGVVREDIEAFITPFIIRGAINYWIQKKSLRGELNEQTSTENPITDQDFLNALAKLFLK